MNNFYDRLATIIKSSNDSELSAFRRVINSEITKEERYRKKSGFKIKMIKCKTANALNPIPKHKVSYEKRIKYIQFVLDQNWDYLFDSDKYDKQKKYYVYAHIDPGSNVFNLKDAINLKGIPFYIGKGTGDRAWDMHRNQGHDIKVRDSVKSGYQHSHIVNIVKKGLSESAALALESKLIYIFQTVYEDQLNGVLYNLDKGRRPDFKNTLPGSMPARSSIIVRKALATSDQPGHLI